MSSPKFTTALESSAIALSLINNQTLAIATPSVTEVPLVGQTAVNGPVTILANHVVRELNDADAQVDKLPGAAGREPVAQGRDLGGPARSRRL
jgi:hypothetical protein